MQREREPGEQLSAWLNNGASGEPDRCNLFNFYNTMAKKKSIVRQAVERLLSMAAFGDSKHADKIANDGKPAREKIYSSKTMDNYIDVAGRFVRWAKTEHGCRTVDEARPYVAAYLQFQIGQHKSAWTVRTVASGLAKLYGCGMGDFGVALPERYRKDVTQHRGKRWSGHYNAYKHRELELFCRSCGLRRHEVSKLRPEDVYRDEEVGVIVHVVRGRAARSGMSWRWMVRRCGLQRRQWERNTYLEKTRNTLPSMSGGRLMPGHCMLVWRGR